MKALRPKPWKEGFFKKGGRSSRIDGKSLSGGERVWPGREMEMGGMGQGGRGMGREMRVGEEFREVRSAGAQRSGRSEMGRPVVEGMGEGGGRDPYRTRGT